jgi:hypothetical protein
MGQPPRDSVQQRLRETMAKKTKIKSAPALPALPPKGKKGKGC